MRYIHIILFALGLFGNLAAQSAKDELKLLMEAHSAESNYHHKVNYKFFGNNQPEPLQVMDGISLQYDNLYYFKLGDIEQVKNKQWTITIDKDQNYVLVDKAEKYNSDRSTLDFKEILTAIDENGDHLEFEKINSDKGELKIFKEAETTPAWQIFYNLSDHQITAISVFFNAEETEALYGDEFTSSRLDISIQRLTPSKPDIQIDSVIAYTDKTIRLQPKYKKFILYNLSEQN